MSVTGEFSSDIYRQMIDLQEKLKQSEAERMRLEEMFDVLWKTFKEDEKMHLKNLENRYQTFLKDCLRRSDRNEKILRSIERVESSANILYAKTERLKQLRNHYEAYLGRVIPSWKQAPPLHYDYSPIASIEDIEWRKHQQELDDILEPSSLNNYYFSRGDHSKKLSSMKTNKGSEVGQRLLPRFMKERNLDEKYEKYGSQEVEPTINGVFSQVKAEHHFPEEGEEKEKEKIVQEASIIKKIESSFDQNSNKFPWDSSNNLPREVNVPKEFYNPYRTRSRNLLDSEKNLSENTPSNVLQKLKVPTFAGVSREIKELPLLIRNGNISEREYPEDSNEKRPMITREPVEIRKPEFIVGKLHPVVTSKFGSSGTFDEIDGAPKRQATNETESASLFEPNKDNGHVFDSTITEKIIANRQPVNNSNMRAKSSIRNCKKEIEKPKEVLLLDSKVEEQQCNETVPETDKQVEESYAAYANEQLEEMGNEENGKEDIIISQRLEDGVHQENKDMKGSLMNAKNVTQKTEERNIKDNLHEMKTSNIIESSEREIVEEQYVQNNYDSDEDVYEDNEEAYPESYYEQPVKPLCSNDIVSNVILEEDESEVNMSEDMKENNKYSSHEVNERISNEEHSGAAVDADPISTENFPHGYDLSKLTEMKAADNTTEALENVDKPGRSIEQNTRDHNYQDIESQNLNVYDDLNISNFKDGNMYENENILDCQNGGICDNQNSSNYQGANVYEDQHSSNYQDGNIYENQNSLNYQDGNVYEDQHSSNYQDGNIYENQNSLNYQDGNVYESQNVSNYQNGQVVSPNTCEGKDMNENYNLCMEERNNTQEQYGNESMYKIQYDGGEHSEEGGYFDARITEREPSYQLEEPYVDKYNGESNTMGQYIGNQGQYYKDANNSEAGHHEGEESNLDDFQYNVKDGNKSPDLEDENSIYMESSKLEHGEDETILRDSAEQNLIVPQNNLAHLLESDSESFQIEHGSGIGNEDSDFDFSISQK